MNREWSEQNRKMQALLKMPLSRHWIMHIEAAGRIICGIAE